MSATTYFEYVIDPSTGQQIEVRDRYAREQLVHKTEKTVVNSLPAKPTDKEEWLSMERFIYYVPVEGETDKYEAWTLFFIGDPTVASDYTDTDKYQWVQIATTDSDLNNFSTKGHTHEVIPETEVEDHEYTPQGSVSGTFTGSQSTTESNGAHTHTFTPSGSVSSSFSGTQCTTSQNGAHTHTFTPEGTVTSEFTGNSGNTSTVSDHSHSFTPEGTVSGTFSGTTGTTEGAGSHDHTLTKTKKKMSTKSLSVTPATAVDFTGSTTDAQRATGALEALSTYDASKAVFNGISVNDGVLSFVTKKMTTADTVSGLSASVDASKVSLDNSGTVSGQAVATGQLADGTDNDPLVMTDASVGSNGAHTHDFTPSGTVSGTFTGTSGTTGDAGSHSHSVTPSGSVSSTFSGTGGNTGSNGDHTHTVTPAGSVNSQFSGSEGTTGSDGSHTHDFTPSGAFQGGFQGVKASLKHKVDNKKVRTAPDQEDEGSHAFDWYGILFDEEESDPHKTRVGNMDMHRMLPIQTKMRRCLLNDDGTVNYYLDDRDSTKKAGSQEGWVTEDETSMSRVETDDIRDSNELVEALKGNSCVWNQLMVANPSSTLLEQSAIYTGTKPFIKDNKFYISFEYTTTSDYASTSVDVWLSRGGDTYGGSKTIYGIQPSNTGKITLLLTSNNSGNNSVHLSYLSAYGSGSMVANNINVIDLTLLGIDNLTTVAQVEAWLAENVGLKPYYAYNAGSIVNAVMTGVKTTFDGGTNTYPFDVRKVYGQLDGEGSYVQCYPNGMRRCPNAKDFVRAEKAVVMTKEVDLGEQSWSLVSGQTNVFYCFISGKKGPTSYNDVGNIVITKYNVNKGAYLNSAGMLNYMVQENWSNHTWIMIKDTAYSDETAFKTSLAGVKCIIELNTPLTYTNLVYRDNGVDTPLSEVFFPNGIVVGKGGTVEIQPQNTEEIVTCAPTLTMKKYVLQAGATLDGTDGQVMVEIPEHWRKVYTYLDGAKTMVKAMISPYPQTTTGWVHVKKGYISAYEANIDANDKLCSTSDIKDLVLSIVNGKVNATCDISLIGETDHPADWAAWSALTSKSLLPTTSVTMGTLRTDARARGNVGEYKWNMLVYEMYLAVYWLYVIEYANLNSQEAFTTALNSEGFHQGGLGDGATTTTSAVWDTFNGYKPFIPCGITNCLGNHSGEVFLALPSAFGTSVKMAVNSYHGIELPFGHIWKFADGIKYLGDGTQQEVLRCDSTENYSSDSSSSNYTSIGNNVAGSGVYKKKIMVDPDGDINCKDTGGGSLQYYCDYNYEAHANGTYYCCMLGGVAFRGASSGLACVRSLYAVSDSDSSVGSRLCFFEK